MVVESVYRHVVGVVVEEAAVERGGEEGWRHAVLVEEGGEGGGRGGVVRGGW